MKRITWILTVLLALAGACKPKDKTKLIVQVSSDLAGGGQLSDIRIDVTGPTTSRTEVFSLASEPIVQLALVPRAAKDASLTIKATGLLGPKEIVWQAVQTAFVPGQSKLLKLFLGFDCAKAGCDPAQSCSAGACMPVPIVSELPDYDPNAPVAGGGTKPNGGRTGGTGGAAGSGGTTAGGGLAGMGGTLGPGDAGVFIGGTATGGLTGMAGTTTGGGTTATGGTVATAGASGSTSVPNCPNGLPCGGDVEGTWNVTSSCLTISGTMQIGAGLNCPIVPAAGFLQVTGSWTAKADGSYLDDTTTTGTVTFPLSVRCLTVSNVLVPCADAAAVFKQQGWASSECREDASGVCNCRTTVDQKGGLGVISAQPSTSGVYSTRGSSSPWTKS